MNNSKSEENQRSNNGGEFFGAVSRNCKTVIVENSKRAVKSGIAQRGISKHNVAMFKCQLNGKNIIQKELLNRPGFKLTNYHHRALTDASLAFLQNRVGV